MSGLTQDGKADSSRKTNFSGANGDRENIIFPCYPTMTRNGNHIWSIHTLLSVLTIHTYGHLGMTSPPIFCSNVVMWYVVLAFLRFGTTRS